MKKFILFISLALFVFSDQKAMEKDRNPSTGTYEYEEKEVSNETFQTKLNNLLLTPYAQQVIHMTQEEKNTAFAQELETYQAKFRHDLSHLQNSSRIILLLHHNARPQITPYTTGTQCCLIDAFNKKDTFLIQFFLANEATFLDHPVLWCVDNQQHAEFLLDCCGVDIHTRDGMDRSILHGCVYGKKYSLVEYYLKRGANIKAIDDQGYTILHMLATSLMGKYDHSNSELDQKLLLLFFRKGVDIEAKNKEQKSVENMLSGYTQCQNSSIRTFLSMIAEERNRRAFKMFMMGWQYSYNQLSLFPTELVVHIHQFVKAPPYKLS